MGNFCDLIVKPYDDAWDDFASGYARELWMIGGRNSIKSTVAGYMVSAMVMGVEDLNAMVLRKYQTNVRTSVFNQCLFAIAKLDELNPELQIKRRWKINATSMTMTFDGRRSIVFHGLDDPEKVKSEKPQHGYYGLLWMEELNQFSKDELESVRKSVIRGGPVGQSIYTFNPPKSKSNWVNAEAMRPKRGRVVYRTSYLDVLRGGHADWIGQTFIDDAADLKKADPKRYEWELMGVATGTGGEIFDNVVAEEFDPDALRASGAVEESWGQDFGFTNHPSTTIGELYDAKTQTLYIFDELIHFGPRLDEIIAWAVKRGLGEKDVIADRAGDLAIAEMQRNGLARTRPCWKSPNGWREEGLRWMQTRRRIVIHPKRCPYTLNEFTKYESDRYANGDVKEGYPKVNDDTIDGARYGAEAWIKREQVKKVVPMPKAFSRGWN